jgi:hypothetical protein
LCTARWYLSEGRVQLWIAPCHPGSDCGYSMGLTILFANMDLIELGMFHPVHSSI